MGDYKTHRCPRRHVLDNPWIGAVFQAQDLITLEHSNKMHDAVGAVKMADAWKQKQDFEKIQAAAKKG